MANINNASDCYQSMAPGRMGGGGGGEEGLMGCVECIERT